MSQPAPAPVCDDRPMDPRIARTRAALRDALRTLAADADLDAISIADITEAAGVNRSSFYRNYASKDELLAEVITDQISAVRLDLDEVDPTDPSRPPDFLVEYAKVIHANAGLYRRVLGPNGSVAAQIALRNQVTGLAMVGIEEKAPGPLDMPVRIVAAAAAGSVLGVVTEWVQMDPLPDPATAAGWAWRTLLGPAETARC